MITYLFHVGVDWHNDAGCLCVYDNTDADVAALDAQQADDPLDKILYANEVGLGVAHVGTARIDSKNDILGDSAC